MDMVELFGEKWAESGIVLGIICSIIAYLFTNWWRYRFKRKEIYLNITVKHKIPQIKRFYTAYIDLDDDLKDLYHAVAQKNGNEANQIRSRLKKSWKRFRTDLMAIKLFLMEDDMELINRLNKVLDDVYLKIDLTNIDQNFKQYDAETIREFRKVRDKIFRKDLPALMEEINKTLGKEFRR